MLPVVIKQDHRPTFLTLSFVPSFLTSVDPQGLAPDLVPCQAFQLVGTHRHCMLSNFCGQPPGYLRALHPRHLWPHRYVCTGRTISSVNCVITYGVQHYMNSLPLSVLLHLQEPHLPPALSSSYLEPSTSVLFLKTRSLFCPDPRFRYNSVPPAIKDTLNLTWVI